MKKKQKKVTTFPKPSVFQWPPDGYDNRDPRPEARKWYLPRTMSNLQWLALEKPAGIEARQ